MKLNIICLHGFTQNASIMKKKLANLTKSLKNVNLFYLDGAVILPTESTESTETLQQRAYWIYNTDNPLTAIWSDHYNPTTAIYHLDGSVQKFNELVKQIGQVDGIIGSSQGGCFADYICKNINCSIKFAIFISAMPFKQDGDPNSTIHTLHMFGKLDTIIPMDKSISLAKVYTHNETFIHEGAHIIPSNSAAKTCLRNFIQKMFN